MRNQCKSIITAKYLLIIFLLIFFNMFLYSQESEQPAVEIRFSSASPVSGTSWTLTLLVNHSDPNEVEVLAPPLTGSIYLEQVLKGPRLYNPANGQTLNRQNMAELDPSFGQWTSMEYRFILGSPEVVSFDVFTVTTPLGETKTEPFDITVQRPQGTAESRRYRLAWEGLPARLKTGESAVISLRITGWNHENPLPETAAFMPPLPRSFIMESIPPGAEENAAGKTLSGWTVLSLRIIPLGTNAFSLERRQILHGTSILEIPAVRIPVSPGTSAAAAVEEAPPDTAPPSLPAIAFPPREAMAAQDLKLYNRHQAECLAVYGSAKNLWDRHCYAGALALLRENERNHRAGALFAAIRHEAEESIGLAGTRNEKRGISWPLFREKRLSAIASETDARRIPDIAGEVIAHFAEGQPVLVENAESSGANRNWLRVTTNDDRAISGWVQAGNIIYY